MSAPVSAPASPTVAPATPTNISSPSSRTPLSLTSPRNSVITVRSPPIGTSISSPTSTCTSPLSITRRISTVGPSSRAVTSETAASATINATSTATDTTTDPNTSTTATTTAATATITATIPSPSAASAPMTIPAAPAVTSTSSAISSMSTDSPPVIARRVSKSSILSMFPAPLSNSSSKSTAITITTPPSTTATTTTIITSPAPGQHHGTDTPTIATYDSSQTIPSIVRHQSLPHTTNATATATATATAVTHTPPLGAGMSTSISQPSIRSHLTPQTSPRMRHSPSLQSTITHQLEQHHALHRDMCSKYVRRGSKYVHVDESHTNHTSTSTASHIAHTSVPTASPAFLPCNRIVTTSTNASPMKKSSLHLSELCVDRVTPDHTPRPSLQHTKSLPHSHPTTSRVLEMHPSQHPHSHPHPHPREHDVHHDHDTHVSHGIMYPPPPPAYHHHHHHHHPMHPSYPITPCEFHHPNDNDRRTRLFTSVLAVAVFALISTARVKGIMGS